MPCTGRNGGPSATPGEHKSLVPFPRPRLTCRMDVLILGGTALARTLAGLLVEQGLDVTTSLAGRTKAPRAIPGAVRIGGFGGPDGLAAWLVENRPGCVVNAVHPFAAAMSGSAAAACRRAGTALARLEAPSWRAQPASADWTWVADHDEAVRAVRRLPDPVLLTIGRQETAHYLTLGARDITHRVIDAPDETLPAGWTLLTRRGPFSRDGERALMADPAHTVATLVTKDSGGVRLDPKLLVAAEIGAAVVMVSRPPAPDYGDRVSTPQQAAEWVAARLHADS